MTQGQMAHNLPSYAQKADPAMLAQLELAEGFASKYQSAGGLKGAVQTLFEQF